MGAGIFNILMGVAAIIAGASGEVVLIGTGSGPALIAVGAVIGGIGLWQVIRSQRGR